MKKYNSNGNIDKIVKTAKDFARELTHEYITVEHLLCSLLYEKNFYNLLELAGVQTDALIEELETYINNFNITAPEVSEEYPKKTHGLERVFNRAFTQVLFSGRNNIQMIDLYLSILNESHSHASYFLSKYGAEKELIVEVYKQLRHKKTDDAMEKVVEEYCTNLNKLAQASKIDPVIGRDKELKDIAQILARKTKSNVILVGDAGVGKTAIAEGLAEKIVTGSVSAFLKDWTVYSLSIGQIIAGTKYRGELEERLKDLVGVLTEMKNVILFIDEVHQIKGAGSSNSSVDIANMLKPALARGDLKVIASTTWEEFTQHFEKDRALMRRFNLLSVTEPSIEVSKQILTGLKSIYEEYHNVTIDLEAIDTAVELSSRYQTDKRLPDKAIDLIDSACALRVSKDSTDRQITADNIKMELSRITNIPMEQFGRENQTNLVDITDNIKFAVFGQDQAIDQVLDRLWVSYAGLKSESKPIGSFLFLGPTGTGKTELAKQLSSMLSMKLLRFDMSEYQEKHTVSRLIGAPPGYVGYEDANLAGGLLISEVSKNPHAILLFDEIEKAHPEVSQILLQIMDEGFVTGSNGKRADCRNCLVILTSNLGAADNERNAIGFASLAKSGEDDKAVQEFFRPEFRNRLDAIIKFNKLSKDVIKKIATKFIAEVNAQLIDKGITVTLTEAAWDYLVNNGYSDTMGARPMYRLIQEKIKVPLAKKILFDKIPPGVIIKVESLINNDLELTVERQNILHRPVHESVEAC
jgi:ATP-dependent Clp protease ATP-binding subunit ClpA